MSLYTTTPSYWLCYNCGRQILLGQGCGCYNTPRACAAQHPEYKDVYCCNSLYGITAICYSHQGFLWKDGKWQMLYWNSNQFPSYKLTVTTGTPPVNTDFTLDQICDLVLSSEFTGEFFTNGKKVTKQIKELMRKYQAIKELLGEDDDED